MGFAYTISGAQSFCFLLEISLISRSLLIGAQKPEKILHLQFNIAAYIFPVTVFCEPHNFLLKLVKYKFDICFHYLCK